MSASLRERINAASPADIELAIHNANRRTAMSADAFTGADRWRVFIGMWDDGDPSWTQANETFQDYHQAREALTQRYIRWRRDSCPSCVRTAAIDEAWLLNLPTGAEFVGSVEGDDYLLIRADRETVDDLWSDRVGRDPGLAHSRKGPE